MTPPQQNAAFFLFFSFLSFFVRIAKIGQFAGFYFLSLPNSKIKQEEKSNLDFLNGQRKREGESSYYAHARGPCSGKAGGQPPSVAKTAQKTGQPAARETAAKTRKNSQVLRSDRTAKTPEDLAAFTASGTAQTPAHNDIICGMLCFFGRRSACLAAFISAGQRLHQLARHGQRYGRGATFLIGFFGLFRHKPSCSSPPSLVPRMVYEGGNDRKDILLIPFFKRFAWEKREEGVYAHTVSRKNLHWEMVCSVRV